MQCKKGEYDPGGMYNIKQVRNDRGIKEARGMGERGKFTIDTRL